MADHERHTLLMTRDCTGPGHLWRTADGKPYARVRGQSSDTVPVTCAHCPATTELPKHSGFSGSRGARPVDHSIPPQFKQVLDRALAEAAKQSESPAASPGPVSTG